MIETPTGVDPHTRSVLMNLDVSKVDNVPMKGQWTMARVVKVIDGDTVSIVMMIGDYPLKVDVRVLGVDCPESLKRNAKSVQEMNAGIAVKKHITDMLQDRIVDVKLDSKDKYCRFVGDVRFEGCSTTLSRYLLDNEYGKSYLGAKKEDWTDNELSLITTRLCK